MGLLDAVGAGIGQAAEGLAASSMEQIKAQIDQDRQAALMQMQAQTNLETAPKLEAARLEVQSKAADTERAKVGLIGEKAMEGVDPADTIKSLRAQADAYQKAGYNDIAKDFYNRIDKLGDNELNKSYRDWQMKHGDETLAMSKEQAAESLKMEKRKLGIEAGKLDLAKKEKADANKAIDAYVAANKNLLTLDKATDEKGYKEAVVAKELAALNLMKFGLKVGGDAGETYDSKVLKDPMGDVMVTTGNKTGLVKSSVTAEQLRKQAEGSGAAAPSGKPAAPGGAPWQRQWSK